MAAPLLSVLALSVFFVGMIAITNAILQATKHERLPIFSMLAGAVVKIITSIVLIGIPSVGIYGTPIGTLLCYGTTTVINFYYISKYVDIRPKIFSTFVKPLAASVVCCLGAYGAYLAAGLLLDVSGRAGNALATFAALGVAVVIYLLAILLLRALSRDDMRMIPKGDKIYGILHKIKLM